MSQGETNWVECASLLRQVYDGTERDLNIIEQTKPAPQDRARTPKPGFGNHAASGVKQGIDAIALESLSSAELVLMADAIVPQVPAMAGGG